MDIKYAILAERAFVLDDGRITVANIFTKVTAPNAPFRCPLMAVMIGVQIEPSERHRPLPVRVRVVRGEDNPLECVPVWELEQGVTLQLDTSDDFLNSINHLILNIEGMEFTEFGMYRFEFFSSGNVPHFSIDLPAIEGVPIL